LKEKVKTEKGFPIESQKIIFKGKTTNNEDTIEKLGIKETDFLVVMSQIQVVSFLCRNPNQRRKKKSQWTLKSLSKRRNKISNRKKK
jgi:hypothetical protein